MAPEATLAPTLLLAMPQLLDPNFSRSVVLLCEHNETGALGFVVNRPTDTPVTEAVALDPPVEAHSGLVLWTGGPVEPNRGFLLLGFEPSDGPSEPIAGGFHLTASMGTLRRLLEAPPAEATQARARLLLGYAGWGPGQLDRELAESAWLTAPVDAALVFETPPEQMWERAIRGLGVDPMALQAAPGLH